MSNNLLIVQYDGGWINEVTYEGYEVCGVFHKESESLDDLQEAVEKMINRDLSDARMVMKYQIREGYKPITISNETSLLFYKELKKKETDYTKIPLCVTLEPKKILSLTSMACTDTYIEGQLRVQPISMISDDVLKKHRSASQELVQCAKRFSKDLVEIASESMKKIEQKHNNEAELKNSASLDGKLEVGQTFSEKAELKKFISLYAIKHQFQFMVRKSCQRQYFLRCIDNNCSWRLKASRVGCAPTFKIRKVSDEHICSFGTRMNDQRQATADTVGKFVQDKFMNLKTNYTPADIIRDMKNMYGVSLSYKKAWRARQKALENVHGHPFKSYLKLPKYLDKLLDANPGSIVKLKTDNSMRFEYVFISLKASIKGWEHCRAIIIVDGTFLKATYGGTLITTSTQDAAGHILPLAYGVVDSENNNAYHWFFDLLKNTLSKRNGLCIVSDRHKSIRHAISKVFPEAAHCVCAYHLSRNIISNYKENLEAVKGAFFGAAYAYTIDDFKHQMDIMWKANKHVVEYLKKIGFERWSRIHCKSNRFLVMTSNAAETINSTMKAARELPVTVLLESIHGMQQDWSVKNRKEAECTFSKLAKLGHKMLEANYRDSMRLTVQEAGDEIFKVKQETQVFIVNLKEKTCSCNRFQMDELPCAHAISVIKGKQQEPEDYCSHYYYTSTLLATYNDCVFPVDFDMHKDSNTSKNEIQIIPPEEVTVAGRKRKKRMKSAWEHERKK